MAIKNIDLNIKRPNVDIGNKVVFTTGTTADGLRIPRRYPFADIANYNDLKADGFFRHATTDVSEQMGGSKTADTEGKLGFELPNTEKLILLARKGITGAETVTLKGSKLYGIDDMVVTLPAGEVGDLYEINLFDFGLYISGVAGEDGIKIEVSSPSTELALIARMG